MEVIVFVVFVIEVDCDKVVFFVIIVKLVIFGYEVLGGECEEFDCFV